MEKYFKLPTHTKYGWLVYLLGFFVAGVLGMLFSDGLLKTWVIGSIQWVFVIAFLVEIVAKIVGKNKVTSS